MARADIIIGTVVETERIERSATGNPRFAVTIEDKHGDRVKRRTAPNAMLAFAIENPEYRESVYAFEVNGRGNITRVTLNSEFGYDTESSASRQHFIDTGRYLLMGEAESVYDD